MKITLIGFMGSGKTTVAQALSENLNLPLTDLDQLIVDRAGLSIPAYFDQYGKPAFRLFEQEVLVDALAADGILSTGGGTPVQPASQAVFKAHQGPIIFLDANDATIQKRLEADGIASRPLFQQLGMDGLLKLKRSRQATYEDLATTVIHVDEKDPATIAQEIIDQLTS